MNQRVLITILIILLVGVSGGAAYLLLRDPGRTREPAAEGALDDRRPAAATAPAAAAPPQAPPARFTRAATTGDPNGFSNVRGGPSVEHPVIARVEQGDTFTTYPQEGEWWEVRTADGTVGYMARQYIRAIDGGAPATAAAPAQGQPPVVVVERPAAAPAVQPAPVRSAGGMVFPDSDRRYLTPGDVAGLSLGQLRIARNEIYARRGRAFADPALARYFSQFSWYRPRYTEVGLSRVEAANVALLQSYEGRAR